jgi:hypothetical protein
MNMTDEKGGERRRRIWEKISRRHKIRRKQEGATA